MVDVQVRVSVVEYQLLRGVANEDGFFEES